MLDENYFSTYSLELDEWENYVDPSHSIHSKTNGENFTSIKDRWREKIDSTQNSLSFLVRQALSEESMLSQEGYSIPWNARTIHQSEKKNRFQNAILISNSILNPITLPNSTFQAPASPTSPLLKSQLLINLKEKGYDSLAAKLESHSGHPWDEIEKIRNPILMEQLIDIHLLGEKQHNKANNDTAENTMKFALHLAHLYTASNFDSNYTLSHELLEEAKHLLGQLIYLIDKDSSATEKIVTTKNFSHALTTLKHEFSQNIQGICKTLEKHYTAHDTTQLQPPEIAMNNKVPFEIAKALLTDRGTVNVGIIDLLSDIFLAHDDRLINHEANLSYALKLLQRSPKLRAEFEQIHKPKKAKLSSNEVITASLGLKSGITVDDKQASLTALTAMLSHLRQGNDGSCFATSLGIEILSSHLGFCFKDFRQLLEESKLTRNIKGISKDIPFMMRINDRNLNHKVFFDTKGFIYLDGKKAGALWDAPGLQKVCESLGFEDCQKAFKPILREISSIEKGKFHEKDVKWLIRKLCAQKQQNDQVNLSIADLYARACFIFSSQTTQPLLEVWVNAIASMAEAEEGSMMKTAVLETVLDSLQYRLGELNIPATPFLQRFFMQVQSQLSANIKLQYDPFVQGQVSKDLHSSQGGFVLNHNKQPVKNENDFRRFIKDILLNTNIKLASNSLSENEKLELNAVQQILNSFIDTNEFMGYLLSRYHPSNKEAVKKMAKGQVIDSNSLPFTPWSTRCGNNSKAVLKVYFETDQPITAERFVNKKAEEALTNIIDLCKRMPEEEKELFANNPNKLKPFCILGKHRLPFMAGNPSLSAAWQQNHPTQDWIERYVINPGQNIANARIDLETKAALSMHLCEKVFPTQFNKAKVTQITELIKKIPYSLSTKDYRNEIVKVCQKVDPSLANPEKLKRRIDSALCQCLPLSVRKKLEDTAVHFADTNWSRGIQDIHFCFAVNPGTGNLELMEADANGGHLVALDQAYWLINQKWEFLTIPKELVPDDSLNLT